MSTTRLSKRASAAFFVLATTLGLGAASVVPAQSAVVAAAPTSTSTTVAVQSPSVAYGETSKVTVTVDAATNGPKPAGKVELKIGDKILIADLASSGKADFDLPLLGASTTPYAVTATFIPTDATAFSTSTSAPVNVTVTKDATTSTVTARHNKLKRKIVAKNVVASAHGQVPTGSAKFVLRRNGLKVASIVASLDANGVAKATFRKVRGKGTYKVISRFRGSANFSPSKGSFKIPA